MVDDLNQRLAFLLEVDRLKLVDRQSKVAGGQRRENSAEHSWHLALFALILGKDRPIDLLKTLTILLIHDLVEIDAGDTPLHSVNRQDKMEAEKAAAKRIFGLLPPGDAADCLALWDEFETGNSAEAVFARGLDRLQPLLLNLLNEGGTWAENSVGEQTVMERYGPAISTAFPDFWPIIEQMVRLHFAGRQPPEA
ncbi:HD domain-containing protein [Rhizobium sp. 16-449-1b]|uniref:HD domain-containing protein n=1 Tax=Rhizobium sp. 16-449-1b TaxID=2819989 RepID=UPI001ADC8C77|nr:HD domain-containing protein [Rhizobium sp. 16-449-1b]